MQYSGFPSIHAYEQECARIGHATRRIPPPRQIPKRPARRSGERPCIWQPTAGRSRPQKIPNPAIPRSAIPQAITPNYPYFLCNKIEEE